MDNNNDNNGLIPRIRNAVRNVLHSQNSSEPTSAQPQANQHETHSDSDDSMPELQSVSSSSDEEMEDDGHRSEDEVVPMLVPPDSAPSRRRARSEEDVDGELRDRRNPVERTGNDHRTQSRTQPPDPPPQPANPPADNERQRRVPLPFNLLSLLLPIGINTQANNNTPNNNNGNARIPGIFGGIAISIPGPNGTTVTHPIPMTDGANPFQFFLGGDGNNSAGLGDFMTRFHEFLNASLAESNREDPERAKRLVDALEPVPIGLVKRLERVGDVGGGDDHGTGGDSVCAICWDSLLGGDVDVWNQPSPTNKDVMEVDPASIPLPESGTSTPLAETAPPTKPMENITENKIVSLPCAHVFHASCLIPWFTRPNQTTCPTCRFNIDPEELTRTPPRPIHSQGSTSGHEPRPMNHPQPGPQPQAAAAPGVHVHLNDHDHHHDHDHGEDGIDVFFDMAVDIGLGPEQNEMADLDHSEGNGNEEDDDDEEDTMPGLEPIRRAPRTTIEDEDEEMPPLEPITTPFSPLSGRRNPAPSSQSTPSSQPQSQQAQPTATPSQPSPQPNASGQQQQQQRRPQNEGRREIQLPLFNFDIVFTNPIPIVARTGGPQRPAPHMDNEDEWEDEQVWVVPSQAEADAATATNTPPVQLHTRAGPNPTPRQRGRQSAVNLPGLNELFGPMEIPAPLGGGNGGNAPPRSASAPPSRNPPADENNNAGGQQGPRQLTAADIVRHLVGASRAENQAGGLGRVGLGATMGTHGRNTPNPNPNPNPTPAPANTDTNTNANANARPEVVNNPLLDFVSILARLVAVAPDLAQQGPAPQQQQQQPQGQRPPTPAFTFRHQGQTGPQPPPQTQQRRNNTPFVFGRPSTQAPPPRKEWSLPSPPGLTLRQRVERAEREAGLRCDDVNCGVGPSDEEPELDRRVETISILRRLPDDNGKGKAEDIEPACVHKLHSSCLVSAERVAWSSRNEEKEAEVEGKDYIDVECPVCRVQGCVSKEAWLKGVAE